MIDFSLAPEQNEMRALARRFARDRIAPQAADLDREARWPSELVREATRLGLANVSVPEAQGGLGLGMLDQALIGEELAYGCMGVYTILMASELGTAPIVHYGTEAQRDRFLAPLVAQGDDARLAAFALSEPDAGSDLSMIRTRAVRDGDGWRLTGRKMWISNGARADLTVVFATVDPDAGRDGSVALVVPAGADGLNWNEVHGKLGQRAAHTYEMVLNDVRVPGDHLLGEVGDGLKVALGTLDRTRIPVAAGSVGVARRALDEATRYALQRRTFGKPIAKHQAVGFKLAEMEIRVHTARWQTWHAAWLADAGRPCGHHAAIAKTYASDAAFASANAAIDVLGGYGYVDDYPVQKLLRDVKLNQIYEGTNDIQRLVIVRGVLDAHAADRGGTQ